MMKRGRLKTGVAAALAAVLLGGCLSMQQVRGTPGMDLSAVRAGAQRAEIEARLGAPVRQWTTAAGVEYRVYRYDAGVPGDPAAVFLVPIDVLTLGLPSLVDKIDEKASGRPPGQIDPARLRNLAVAYDAAGIVLGVFIDIGDFERLPDDGRPVPRR